MTPIIFAAALSILASGQATSAPSTDTTSGASQDDADLNKIVCKREQITGSRFNKRICLTRAEWAEQTRNMEEQARRFGEAAGRSAAGATGGGMTNGGQ